ncbi:hypothetical protein [Aquimarina sp. 2201CG14-23]|uniref:hypothetical protein n=1 Tax=Aquimarina mycalae TaxID=3040073 RepID=UPI00247802C8|nr:hypothetical protein [Aquimarina sp. 2201CG14-23]MDH7448183.1 hypothetical protein [Aquimarina sp. 2201CG14-23]
MKTKDIIFLSPEIYLICATLYYWFLTSNLFNPIAIILLTILVYQTIYKKLTIGLIIASLFIVLNLYMVLALISELSEFPESNENFMKLLIFGTLFLGINLIVAVYMFWKYVKKTKLE